jgi:hypothetical protein
LEFGSVALSHPHTEIAVFCPTQIFQRNSKFAELLLFQGVSVYLLSGKLIEEYACTASLRDESGAVRGAGQQSARHADR